MQSESEKVPSVRVWRRNRPSQRDHLQATTEADASVVCFVVVILCASAYTHYKTNTGIAGLSLSLGIIIRVARIIMLYFQQYPRECFALRADAVKDERSEVNHISGNACALSAEDSKGKAQQSEATAQSRHTNN